MRMAGQKDYPGIADNYLKRSDNYLQVSDNYLSRQDKVFAPCICFSRRVVVDFYCRVE